MRLYILELPNNIEPGMLNFLERLGKTRVPAIVRLRVVIARQLLHDPSMRGALATAMGDFVYHPTTGPVLLGAELEMEGDGYGSIVFLHCGLIKDIL
jgi:hypothetical protein